MGIDVLSNYFLAKCSSHIDNLSGKGEKYKVIVRILNRGKQKSWKVLNKLADRTLVDLKLSDWSNAVNIFPWGKQ